jgi:ubiquinone/menaquinone biosynthesis C-methylase UbiE
MGRFEDLEITRVGRPRRAARETYDRLSRWYDLLEGGWETRARTAGLKLLAVRAGERVLEIGPGTGHSLAALAGAVGPQGLAAGMDLSPRMLAQTGRTLAREAPATRPGLVCGDALQLPFAAGAFDAIFMSFVLELIDTPEIPAVLAECRRVTRVGGRICVVSLDKSCGLAWVNALYEKGHARWPGLLDCRPIFLTQILTAAGFRVAAARAFSLWGLGVKAVLADQED